MNDQEIKKLWITASEKWEESLVISRQQQQEIMSLQVYNLLGSIKSIKIFTLILGVLWVGIGGTILTNIMLYDFEESNKFFLVSALAQIILTAVAMGVYLYQLITLYKVDITAPILKTQKEIASLKSSTLWVTRLLFLQLAFWTTFWWNDTMIQEWELWQGAIILIVTLLFTMVALWLFFNITFENRNKKWFKLIFSGKEWTPLLLSMGIMEQIAGYESSDTRK